MRITCKKCNWSGEVSNADVQAQNGNMFCPRCMSTIKVTVPKQKSTSKPAKPQGATKPQKSRAAKSPSGGSWLTRFFTEMTALRCLGWSVVITLVFFLFYAIIGMIA